MSRTGPCGYRHLMDVVVADVPANLADYELADRFRLEDGRVFLSGVQALARLPVDQLRIDRRHGLNTAAFVVRLPGLAGRHVPGGGRPRPRATVPDLPDRRPARPQRGAGGDGGDGQPARRLARPTSATTAWSACGTARRPGLDRASDAIRHGVFAGTARHGGVVAVVGDDPAAKSSTLPSSSDATIVDLHMPILFPGDVQEALDLGRHAVALSRASGIWVGLKLVTPVADGTGTVDVHPDRVVPVDPDDGVRRQARSSPTRAGGCSRRTRSTWSASSSRSAPSWPAATASPTGSTGSPCRTERRLDRHRRLRPHLPRAARGAAACSASPTTTRCARAGIRLFQLLDAGARRRAAGARLRPRPRRGARRSRRRTRRSSCS